MGFKGSLYKDIEKFTCGMYGKPHYTSVDVLRHDPLREKCEAPDGTINVDRRIDLCQLPPCKKALTQHTRRANYQVAIWKRAHIAKPSVPKPTEGHGWTYVDGKLQPLWFEGPFGPNDVTKEDDGVESNDDYTFDEDDAVESDVN